MAAETGGCSAHVQSMWTTIGFTEKPSADIHVLLSRKTPLQQKFYSEYGYSLNRFDATELGSMRFIRLHAKPHKTRALHLGFMRLCLGF